MTPEISLLVVVYHYIEEQKYTRGVYPTTVEILKQQLLSIGEKYSFISEKSLVSIISGGQSSSSKLCLITFDDGLLSQYVNALPVLRELSVPAVFFIPTGHLSNYKSYLVHKVHYILSKLQPQMLLGDLFHKYKLITGKKIDSSTLDMNKIMEWYRYDDRETALFKFFINHFLHADEAAKIIDLIFSENYRGSEKDFCESLYMGREHIKELTESNFGIGMHTHQHLNIQNSSIEEVARDMSLNYNILGEMVGRDKIRGISYPFGSITKDIYDEKIESVAKKLKLLYGFTTEKKINDIFFTPFLLGRFGSNDISGGKKPIFEI